MQSSFNVDSYRCPTSLRSELIIIKKLLKLAKKCLCPKLRTYAPELEERRLTLVMELKIRAKEENVPVDFGKSKIDFRLVRRFGGA
jgi:hypothetical protein